MIYDPDDFVEREDSVENNDFIESDDFSENKFGYTRNEY